MDDCSDLMEALRREISAFSQENHDPDNRASAWYRIFLAARSLWTEYFSVSILNGKVNCTLETNVHALLQLAHDTIPVNVRSVYREQIRDGMKTVLSVPAEILEIERKVEGE